MCIMMMKTLRLVSLVWILIACWGCSARSGLRQDQAQSVPTIPSHIHNAQEQLKYLVEHYWDNIDLRDSTWLQRRGELENLFVDYFSLLYDYPKPQAKHYLKPLEALEGDLLYDALRYYREAYYEADSPLVSDDIYRHILLWAIQSPKVAHEHQLVAKELLRGIHRNRVGSKASNVVYDNDSVKGLSLLPITERYRLLIFGTPHCPSCRMMEQYIQSEAVYKRLVEKKQLRILTLYIQHGGDRSALAPDSLRPKWLERGIDPKDSVMQHGVYHIKASPSIYLIGKDGKVLLREPKPEQLTQYLENNEKK